jgi:hypothetical protein
MTYIYLVSIPLIAIVDIALVMWLHAFEDRLSLLEERAQRRAFMASLARPGETGQPLWAPSDYATEDHDHE